MISGNMPMPGVTSLPEEKLEARVIVINADCVDDHEVKSEIEDNLKWFLDECPGIVKAADADMGVILNALQNFFSRELPWVAVKKCQIVYEHNSFNKVFNLAVEIKQVVLQEVKQREIDEMLEGIKNPPLPQSELEKDLLTVDISTLTYNGLNHTGASSGAIYTGAINNTWAASTISSSSSSAQDLKMAMEKLNDEYIKKQVDHYLSQTPSVLTPEDLLENVGVLEKLSKQPSGKYSFPGKGLINRILGRTK